MRNENTLTIVNRNDAKKRDLPVKKVTDPTDIPKTDEMVTAIIQVRYGNAVQMVRDLEPFRPDYATLTANESANTLVLTDVQTNIRRMVQIVKALDTSISGISTIRVFALQYSGS